MSQWIEMKRQQLTEPALSLADAAAHLGWSRRSLIALSFDTDCQRLAAAGERAWRRPIWSCLRPRSGEYPVSVLRPRNPQGQSARGCLSAREWTSASEPIGGAGSAR
jgi:hypothetical protein